MRLLILIISICLSLNCIAQRFSLSGTVKDKNGEALPGAGVYISGYKIATATDNDGKYNLSLNPGNYDILIQLIGFKPYNRNVVIADKALRLDILLEENITQLAEVTIKPDPNRQAYINTFKSFFIGTTPNAASCKILNPDVLIVDYDKENQKLTVQTNSFLIIENNALGYRIKYLLKNFEYDARRRIIYYEGFPHYEDLDGSTGRKKTWAKKRLEAYNGSPQHFFSSLYNNKIKEEGFIIHKLIKNQKEEQIVDSVESSKIGGFTSDKLTLKGAINIHSAAKPNQDSSKKITVAPLSTVSILKRAEITTDTLVHNYNDNIKFMNFTNELYVIYTKEKENDQFSSRFGMSINRPPDIGNYQISLINLQRPPVYFYSSGSIYDPRSMLFSGYWAWEKIADSVPIDYQPPLTK